MVIFTTPNNQCYIDGYLKKNLDVAKDAVPKNKDMFLCIVDGRPGTGKSTLVDQLCHYLSKGKHTIIDKAFLVSDFSKLLSDSYIGQENNSKTLDEGYELNKKKTQSKANFEILGKLQRVRNKGQFVFITLPSVYDLDKNIILNLANLFIHCYRKGDYGSKGFFIVYDRRRLKTLWLKCRDTLSYRIRPNFYGKFTGKWLSGDYGKYDKLKNESFDRLAEEDKIKKRDSRDLAIFKLYKEMELKQNKISEIFGINQSQVSRIISKQEP